MPQGDARPIEDLGSLGAEDFRELVEEVHGHRPFPWQEALLEHALEGTWPRAIRVPTGLGKTTVVDVAVFALAAQAEREPWARTARTRTFVVVDRRIVVDDITGHAQRLEEALRAALADPSRADGAIWRVARRLRSITDRQGGAAEPAALDAIEPPPLVVERMRGGVSWAARWVDRPEQPAVVVSTLDQVGSRLLFRGYGVSRTSRPIDAALVGSDALIVLDEAHLAGPFLETLSGLQAWEVDRPDPVLPGRSPTVVAMSATMQSLPRSRESRPEAVEVGDADRADPVAGPRLRARKDVTLWEVPGGSPNRRVVARDRVAGAMADAARRLGEEPSAAVVGVVCNTVGLARAVFEELRGSNDAWLLIGPSRDVDRARTIEGIRSAAGTDRSRSAESSGAPSFVVATQTVEVGVNLDFDAMVSEVASFDALVQRLGRLDRLGTRTLEGLPTRAVIVHGEALHRDDLIYGEALARTWEQLGEWGDVVEVKGKGGSRKAPIEGGVELGPVGLADLAEGVRTGAISRAGPRRPTLLPRQLLGVWTRTSLDRQADVDIDPFLRGVERVVPRVTLVWRADVHERLPGRPHWRDALRESATRSVGLRAPAPGEQVEVGLHHVRRWLERRGVDELSGVSDLAVPGERQGSPTDDGDLPAGRRASRRVARLQDDLECAALEEPRDLRPGDVLIIPVEQGGLDEYGWNPATEEPVVDVADLCESRRGHVVRLQRSTLVPLSEAAWVAYRAWAEDHLDPEGEARSSLTGAESDELVGRLLAGIRAQRVDGVEPPALEATLEKQLDTWLGDPSWRIDGRVEAGGDPDDRFPVVTLRARRVDAPSIVDLEHQSDADDTASLVGDVHRDGVALDDHLHAVGSRARASAQRLGLPEALVGAVELAAVVHDLGKADRRFQVMLRGGDEFAYVEGDPLLAKSGMDPSDRAAWSRAAREAGWPSGLRHEAISVALLDAYLASAGDEGSVASDGRALDVDLVRHLVGAHHGRNRPLFDPVDGLELLDVEIGWEGHRLKVAAEDLAGYVLDWDSPARFARLVERYGAWGLALLETVVRLADMNCSEVGT